MQKFKIGQITSAVGIKGEVRVFSYMDEITRFCDIEKVYLGETLDKYYTIEKVRFDKGLAIIKFSEVPDRNTSESLKGLNLYIPREEYVLDEDSYFVDDLIDCNVVSEDGISLGRVIKVINNVAQDIYEVEKADKKTFLVPAVHEFIKNVDIDSKTITIHVIDGLVD